MKRNWDMHDECARIIAAAADLKMALRDVQEAAKRGNADICRVYEIALTEAIENQAN